MKKHQKSIIMISGVFMAKYNEKYFGTDEMRINNIEDLLGKDEEILWRAKPKKSAYIWSKILNMFPIALIWGILDGIIIYMLIKYGVFSLSPTPLIVFLIIFFIIHLTPIWIWISNIVTAVFQYKNIEYALTTKRLIIRSGIIIDIKNIFYADIQSVNLRVGALDKILKVGDIYIRSNFETAVLWDIENPYVIANRLQNIVNDIKTDVYYPNDLRPKENKGYKTTLSTGIESNNKK